MGFGKVSATVLNYDDWTLDETLRSIDPDWITILRKRSQKFLP